MTYETESPLSTGEANNTTATANQLASGVRMTGALGSAGDLDYFAILATDRASLISLDFSSNLLSSTNHWQIRLLDSNGDYLRTLATSVAGSPLVNGGSQSASSLAVDNLASLPASGSRFTLVTTSADTTIYTVTSATTLASGGSTFTLDQALGTAPADNTVLAFDPAQSLVSQSASLVAPVSSAGTYYVEVLQADGQDAAWDSSDYQLTATVLPTVETDAQDNSSTTFSAGKEAAVNANNRLLAGAAMTGNLSSATDVDYWVFSTAAASDFSVAFAAASGSDITQQWKIDVSNWDGQIVSTATSSNAGSLTAGTLASVAVDDARYPSATTFVVKVSATTPSVFNTGDYTLKVSGTGLDLNDSPSLTVGSVTSNTPYTFFPNVKVSTISLGDGTGEDADGTGVQLTDMFSVSDPDSGQSISSYWVKLLQSSGSPDAYIRVGGTDYGFGTGDSAANGVTLTAAEMATATFYAGQAAGNLTLDIQAFDSTNAADDSGASAILQQTLHLVSGDIGVTTGVPSATALTENPAPASGDPHWATFTMKLKAAPSADVKIYLTDANDQLDAFKVGDTSSNLVTFTSENWNTDQTVMVTVTAANDGVAEGAGQSAGVSFQVVSADPNYDGYAIAPLAFTVADNAVPTLDTPTTVVYTDTSANDNFATTTSGNATGTLSGSDGNGDTLSYAISGGTVSGDSVSKAGDHGTLTVVAASGEYTFVPDASAINGLTGNASDTFTLTVSDGLVATPTEATFTVNLVGANDTPTLATPAAASYINTLDDDTFDDATGALVFGDRDGQTPAFGISGGTDSGLTVSKAGDYGTLTVTKASGEYTFAPSDAAIEGLNSGSTSETFTVTASDGVAAANATFTVNLIDSAHLGQTINFLAYSWKSHALLDGVSVGFDGAAAQDTAGGGAASFGSVSANSLDLTATLAADSNTGSAVNLQDAIAILKMIVGLNVNSGGNALSPYQAIAADYDANGAVTLTDAIGVLKHVVGLTAPDPAWVFLNEADSSVPAMATGLADKAPPALSANVVSDNSIGLVGVLRGDVDGSWAAPQGSQNLDATQPDYFAALVDSLNASTAEPQPFALTQWGIYT